MQQATKESLLSLRRNLDAKKAVFCLNSLANEAVDADFEEVLHELLQGLLTLRPADRAGNKGELDGALTKVIVSTGIDPYVRAVIRQKNLSSEHTSFLLGPLVDLELPVDLESQALRELALIDDLDSKTIAWLTTRATEAATPPVHLIYPLLSCYTKEEAMTDSQLVQAAATLLAHPQSTKVLLEVLREPSGQHLAGTLLLLGQTQDPEQVPRIGPFIEDFNAWERLSRAILSPQRLEAILARVQASGLAQATNETAASSEGRDRATALASDPTFHRSVARFVSGASPLALASSLVDPEVRAALKGFVADISAPIRISAARALALLKHDDAVPYLRSGLLDRNKRVRQVSQAGLQEILGPERYEALLEELGEESRSLQARLKDLGDWARGALADLEGKVTSAASSVQTGTAKLTDKARNLFNRKGSTHRE